MRRIASFIVLVLSTAGSLPAQCSHDRIEDPNGATNDRLGAAVSISGPVAVIGIPGSDDAAVNAGAAVIHRENSTSTAWPIEQFLLPTGLASGDRFGTSVSVSGGIALIGAPGSDGAAVDTGNARISQYLPQVGLWSTSQTLVASDAEAGDQYGQAVAVRGNVALVGAWQEDEAGSEAGAAYLHRQDPGTGFWFQEQKLVAFDGGPGDRFGASVALSSDLAVVGAIGPGFGAGALYVYRYDPGTSQWTLEEKILPTDLSLLDQFAASIAISGDRILAGAWRDDDQGPDSGSAYVFHFDAGSGTWPQEAKLHAPDGSAGDRFGFSVSLSGDDALIGASGDDPEGAASGSSYLFRRDQISGWTFVEKLVDEPEGAPGDRFGEAVAISGPRAIVGAPEHDGIAPEAGVARVFVTSGEDCNENGAPDLCDLLTGTSLDGNGNGVPDECDFVPPVSGLLCERVGDDIVIEWTSGAVYDNVFVSIDGAAALQLPTGTTSYTLLAPPLGFHSFDVTGVTNQVPSATVRCVVALAAEPLTGLSCSAGDPCLFEAILGWDPADPEAASIEISIDGAPAGSLATGSLGATVNAAGPGTYEVCARTRIDDVDPDSGLLESILSDPACCTVTIIDVPALSVSGVTCTVDPTTCTASLSWTNASSYQQIELTVDGVTALIFDGSSTSGAIPLSGTDLIELCLVATTICGVSTTPVCCTVSCGVNFVRGDSNADGFFDIGDPVTILNYLFNSGQILCLAAADGNDDSLIDVSDVIFALDSLFTQGPPPPPPYPTCGTAVSPLGCVSYPPCP